MSTWGCQTVPYVTAPPPPTKPGGIYHRVEAGQTLWRISKLYNIDLDDIIAANNMPDAAKVSAGQLLFIPGARQTLIEDKSVNVNYNQQDNGFIWPVKGKITSYFMDASGPLVNKGINIQAGFGAQVVAARSGTVCFVGESLQNYGKMLIIDHGDGLSSVYARNSRILVRPGERINQGAPVAIAGQNKIASAAELHFEIRKGHRPKNPLYYLP